MNAPSSFVYLSTSRARSAKSARHEVPRFPVRESACADSLMRRCFSRVLLITNLVGKESPRCPTLFADRVHELLAYRVCHNSSADVFEVGSVGEHVDGLDGFEPITPLMQVGNIARLRFRITGNVDDAARMQVGSCLQEFEAGA